MKLYLKIVALTMVCSVFLGSPSYANEKEKIANLEKRVTALEKELTRLQQQEARASKYLKCIQKVEGNALTVPFKILNCIRK